jgi:rhodanese-related sulfurtransferase
LEIRKIFKEIAAIVAVSCLVGAAVNFSLVRRFFAGEFRDSFLSREKYPGIRLITLAEAEDLFAGGSGAAVFVDSRSRREFAAGHIPGALTIPLEEYRDFLPEGILAYPPDRTIVVYCEGGDCQTSLALARLIHDRGFRDIRIFTGGWAEWTASGLPVEQSP